MLFITKLYHRTKYLFNKKKRIENLQWIVIGVRRRSRVRFIPSIETTTKTKDTAETETISPWSSKHSNNTRQYDSSSSRPSYVLIVIVGFRALEHLYLSESFLKCCIEFASLISQTLVLSLNMHRTNHSTTYYSWFKIMKHYVSLILKSYSLSLSLWNHWTRFSDHFFSIGFSSLNLTLSISKMYSIRLNKQERRNEYDTSIVRIRVLCVKKTRGSEMK